MKMNLFLARHPGESRDPGFEMDGEGNFTDWIPAFAGMTGMGNSISSNSEFVSEGWQ